MEGGRQGLREGEGWRDAGRGKAAGMQGGGRMQGCREGGGMEGRVGVRVGVGWE